MSSVSALIYKKLKSIAAVTSVVGANIFPEFRQDVYPAVVYETNLDDTTESYSGVTHHHYEIVVSVVSDKFSQASELADSIMQALSFANWTDENAVIQSFTYRDRREDYIEIAVPTKRLAVIDISFGCTARMN